MIIGAATDAGFYLIRDTCISEGIQVPIFCPQYKFYWILLGYMFGFLPFMPCDVDVFTMPWLTRNYEKLVLDGVAVETDFTVRLLDMVMYWVIWLINTRGDMIFNHMQRRGKFVNYWVINEHDEIDQIFEKTSIRAVLTDRP